MNDITESFIEYKNTTNDAVAASILVLAEIIRNKQITVDNDSIDYLIESLKNEMTE